MMYIKSHGDILRDTHSVEIQEMIELYNQYLADNREKMDRLSRKIYINMDIANVYFWAAARQDPISLEGLLIAATRAVQAFEKIRAGLRALIGWKDGAIPLFESLWVAT